LAPALQCHLVAPSVLAHTLTVQTSAPPTLTACSAADLAGDLFTDLVRRAIPTGSGGLTWLGFRGRGERFRRTPIGWSLYGGQAGIALALAAGARTLRQAALADAARRALRPAVSKVLADPAALCRQLGPGYLHGVAGIAWCLRHAAALLADPFNAGDARAAEAGDGRGGVSDAAAGAAARALETVLCAGPTDCGRHELAGGVSGALAVLAEPGNGRFRAPVDVRLPAVAHLTSRVLARPVGESPGGLAHGSAGVALGLTRAARLLAATERARPAACRTTLSRTARERAELELSKAAYATTGAAWCNGRVGVELVAAQPGIHPVCDSTAAQGLVDRIPAGAPHHLCCGVVGSAVTVATAAELGSCTATRVALAAATVRRLRAERPPRYLAALPPGLHQPGLMQGAAGLALGLLLLDGVRLPNPLAVTA
jgi:lantibiotic modifying enzyme